MTDITRETQAVERSVMRTAGFILAGLAAAIGIGAIAANILRTDDQKYSPEVQLDFRQTQERVSAPHDNENQPGATFRVAIAPVVSPEASLGQYNDLIAYLAGKLRRKPILMRGQSYAQVNDLLRMRQCDMAFVCTYSYIVAETHFGAKLVVVPQINGESTYQSFVIASKAVAANDLSGLRGKRFASCDVLSTSGWLYPMATIKSLGFDAENFFSEHIISGSHDRSVYAVKSGLVDAAAVDSIVYKEMVSSDRALGEKTKVIHESPLFGMPPFVVPSETPPAVFAELQKALLDMTESDAGRVVLDKLGFDRFLVPEDEAYDIVRELHESWQSQP